jgi:membrane-associated protease RseP (regulator of RpoE activity)
MLCSSNRFVILLVIMKSTAVLRFALTAALLIASHGVAMEAPPPRALGAGAGGGLAEGQVGHWTFDGSLKDQVAGNDGVFTARRNAAPTYVEGFDGKQQGAIRFDGVDFVTIRRIVRDEMTIACWVRLDERQPGTATGDQFYMGAGLVQMDDVRFYSRVLSEDEIRRLARSGGGSEVVAGERSAQTGDEQPVVNPRQSPGLLGDSNQIRVVDVLEGSAAEKAGIRQGDIILEVEGTKVESVEALCDCVRNLKIHQKPEVVLVRVGGEGAAERLVVPLASAFTKKG